MSNIRSLPTRSKSVSVDAVALLEAKLAMATMHPVVMGWQNYPTMTMEQRLSDYAFRLGYVARGIEELNRRLSYADNPNPPPTDSAASKEPDHA